MLPERYSVDLPLEAQSFLELWGWLLGTPERYLPVGMTSFGDWFLVDQEGSVFFLDATQAAVAPAATSLGSLGLALQSQERLDEWFMPGIVDAYRARTGSTLNPGECYGWKIHPALGGALEASNVLVLPLGAWQSIASQIGAATDGQEGGAVTGFTVDGGPP